MTQPDHIARIDALTRNARNTWFVLLGALVFVGITLMGVEHIDFYGVDRATKLPLVDVAVPTRYFFVAAPILVASVYGYFHLYLIRLWDALGAAPARIEGQRLGDAIIPWLVTDAALHLRSFWRKDNCKTPRSLDTLAASLNGLLAWGFGIIILLLLWDQSLPARTFWISGIAGLAGGITLVVGVSSLFAMLDRMMQVSSGTKPYPWSRPLHTVATAVWLGMVVAYSYYRTEGPIDRLAALSMIGEDIVERPPGWLPYDIARKDFLADWCKRETVPCKLDDLNTNQRRAFDAEWTRRRNAALTDMRRPDWHKPPRGGRTQDFRSADLKRTFLAGLNLSHAHMAKAKLHGARMEGADLRWAQLQGANFSGAQMEGANFREAQMEGADLVDAQMEGANLWGAQMAGADFSFARMEGADLSWAQMERAVLREARMEGANLSGAQMEGAVLWGARMEGAVLREAQMAGANLSEAQMEGANLSDAQMEGAVLIWAQMEGAYLSYAQMAGAVLSGAQMQGADLSFAGMERADLSGAQMEGARLNRANMAGADLTGAQMAWAVLFGAQMEGAFLSGARMAGVVLSEAQMQGANLSYTFLTGRGDDPDMLRSTDVSAVMNSGGALRSVSLASVGFDRSTDFRNVFFDGSVILPNAFRIQMGNLCQTTSEVLDDAQFFGRWRGWVMVGPDPWVWGRSVPEEWQDVTPIPPSPGCEWKTGPMPGTEAPAD